MNNSNGLYTCLDMMRWVAAFLVVVGHLRSLLFVNYQSVEVKSVAVKILYFLTGFGHQAVVVFFVISGFLVGGGVIKQFRDKEVNKLYLKQYLTKRFSRIYIVLLPALFVGGFLDFVGLEFWSDLYSGAMNLSAFGFDAASNLGGGVFLGNVFNMQTILVPAFGSNGPLWSLAYEWVYYILFPLLFINNITRGFLAVFLVCLLLLNEKIVFYGVIWVFGALVSAVPKVNIRFLQAFLFWGGASSVLVSLIISRGYSGLAIDYIFSICLCFWLLSMRFKPPLRMLFSSKAGRFHNWAADFSYSTYLFHFPFTVFCLSVLNSLSVNMIGLQPDFRGGVNYCALLFLIYLFSYAMYLLFESKTKKLQLSLLESCKGGE